MFKLKELNTNQTTIRHQVEMLGFSAYSKNTCRAVFRPAAHNVGIVFVVNGVQIKTNIENLKLDGYNHTTSLASNGVEVSTVEHILSAVRGMEIDNIYIDLPEGQIPFQSSSAEEFSRTLANAGSVEQPEYRKVIVCDEELALRYEETDTEFVITPSEVLRIDANIDFSNLIGKQSFVLDVTKQNYLNYIAPSRSFMRSHLDDKGEVWQNVKKIFPGIPDDPTLSPVIVFSENEFITPLRTPDEPVKHKILDMLGDLSLVGIPLVLSIEVNKPGHEANKFLSKKIVESLNDDERKQLLQPV